MMILLSCFLGPPSAPSSLTFLDGCQSVQIGFSLHHGSRLPVYLRSSSNLFSGFFSLYVANCGYTQPIFLARGQKDSLHPFVGPPRPLGTTIYIQSVLAADVNPLPLCLFFLPRKTFFNWITSFPLGRQETSDPKFPGKNSTWITIHGGQ